MSTEYYLSNRKKKEEVQTFNSFWENRLIPELKKRITDYCMDLNGIHVNQSFAEQIIDNRISPISCTMTDSTSYETLIGSSYWNGKRTLFQWEGAYVDGHVIRDEISVVEFYSNKENQTVYSIVDEYGTEYTLNAFLDKIKSKTE